MGVCAKRLRALYFDCALAPVPPVSEGDVSYRVGDEDDEIVYDSFHMERMSDQHIWFAVGGVSFDLSVQGRSKIHWSVQDGRGWAGIAPTFAETAALTRGTDPTTETRDNG